MRQYHSSILIFTCFTSLGFYQNLLTSHLAWAQIPQASLTIPATETVLKLGSQGIDVKVLQIQLKDLRYYNDDIDGMYGQNTKTAVAEFQKFQNLPRIDGIADLATRQSLQTVWVNKNPVSVPCTPTVQQTDPPQLSQRGFIWWSLLGLVILGSIGGLLFLVRLFIQFKYQGESTTTAFKALNSGEQEPLKSSLPELDTFPNPQENHAPLISSQTPPASMTTAVLPSEMTPRLSKVNVVDELIHDLRGGDRPKQRKAIWNLGQQGDSRAIQPLVDLMMHADSQQRSLILAALAEINTRALTPMNRALAISLQDENPQVRQNAIRDLTRVYDMMIQMSQIVAHAMEDPDVDVQNTARYALSQMNKIRAVSHQQILPRDSDL